jgi:hypothetical protein
MERVDPGSCGGRDPPMLKIPMRIQSLCGPTLRPTAAVSSPSLQLDIIMTYQVDGSRFDFHDCSCCWCVVRFRASWLAVGTLRDRDSLSPRPTAAFRILRESDGANNSINSYRTLRRGKPRGKLSRPNLSAKSHKQLSLHKSTPYNTIHNNVITTRLHQRR